MEKRKEFYSSYKENGDGRARQPKLKNTADDRTLDHICRGWVQRDHYGRGYYLKSGGHTQDGLDKLIQMGVPYVIDKTLPNGVRRGYVDKGGACASQSWFPKDWDRQDVDRAIDAVMENPESVTWRGNHTAVIEGVVDGIRVRVLEKNGKVRTCYPLAWGNWRA